MSDNMPGFVSKAFNALTGYVSHKQYRTVNEPSASPVESYEGLENDEAELERYTFLQQHSVIERFSEFSIAHIEFDDQGQFWNRDLQLNAIEQQVLPDKADEEGFPGVLMIGFVHGWKNNAHYQNGNLKSFRAVLHDIYVTEASQCEGTTRKPRKVVGIYLSWRGLSSHRIRWSPFAALRDGPLTYWNRKKTAHKIGRAGLVDALSWIEQLRFHKPVNPDRTRLIMIGHSFGGAALFSAVAPYIKTVAVGEEKAASLETAAHTAKINGFGDLVVLVNPAFEALLYVEFNRLTDKIKAYHPEQHVVLMTVGADNDQATRKPFLLGQFLSHWNQWSSELQFKMIKTTAANYEPFITHELRAASTEAKDANKLSGTRDSSIYSWKRPSKKSEKKTWWSFLPDTKNWELEETRKPKMPINHAFMSVRTRDNIIENHSGIFRTVFIEFLRDFVIAQDLYAASLPPAPAAEEQVQDPKGAMQKKSLY